MADLGHGELEVSWFVRVSKFAELHVVYSQQAENSCGIACVIMVNFKLKKWMLPAAYATGAIPVFGPIVQPIASRLALESAVKAEKEVYAAYAKVSGAPYDGSAYSYADVLPKVLNELGIGVWRSACLSATAIADKIIANFSGGNDVPMILLLHWTDGGGHFVCCDGVTKSGGNIYANICDPWDGQVRTPQVTKGQAANYAADDPGFHIDFFQSHHDYAAGGKSGAMDGWVIYQTSP
jgi:hypothetical protein